MVDNTSHIARLGNRVLMAAKGEAENSEDVSFVNAINNAAGRLQSAIPPMVNDAKQVRGRRPAISNGKQVAIAPRDANAANRWRDTNGQLLNAVAGVRQVLCPDATPDLNGLSLHTNSRLNFVECLLSLHCTGDRVSHALSKPHGGRGRVKVALRLADNAHRRARSRAPSLRWQSPPTSLVARLQPPQLRALRHTADTSDTRATAPHRVLVVQRVIENVAARVYSARAHSRRQLPV